MQNKKTGTTTQRIIAITTITSLAAAGFANAQTTTDVAANKNIFEQAMSLFRSGKTEEGKQLLTQSGLKNFENMGRHDKNGHIGMMHGKGKGKMQDRKAIEAAILAGNFTVFQQVASTSPLAKIDQKTFNLLTPQFQAKKNAEDQIRNILTTAGVQVHVPGQKYQK